MKDVAGNELKTDDYVVLSTNVSTATQKILFGKVINLKPKSANVRIYNPMEVYSANKLFIRETYVANIRSNSRIFRVPAGIIPKDIKEALDNEFDIR